MPVTADLTKLVDAPVDALAGVSENDAKLLRDAFQVVTIGDLGTNPYFSTAQALVALAGKTR